MPVFSVGDEEEAKQLIVLCCPRTTDGKAYFARELAAEQTLENLAKFSDKLDAGHEIIKKRGKCRCK